MPADARGRARARCKVSEALQGDDEQSPDPPRILCSINYMVDIVLCYVNYRLYSGTELYDQSWQYHSHLRSFASFDWRQLLRPRRGYLRSSDQSNLTTRWPSANHLFRLAAKCRGRSMSVLVWVNNLFASLLTARSFIVTVGRKWGEARIYHSDTYTNTVLK